MKFHKVYLVGAGPGRPDLITLRGMNILKEADVIIYDYLVGRGILDGAKDGAELICADELGKFRYSDGFAEAQDKINELMLKKVREGKKVARLKNGDPSIFGRSSQELEALVREGIEFELVPGITAASAASSMSGIPLTDRRFSSSCVFVTGHEDPSKKKSLIDWKCLAGSTTVVLYMAMNNLDKITRAMIAAGKDENTPSAVIQNAGLASQRILTAALKDIAVKAKEEKLSAPAIVIIGEVAKLEERFNWLKKTRRILFTGLSEERFFLKALYFHLPLIKIEPMEDYRDFDCYLKDIRRFDWLIFASRYGVEYFFKRFRAIGSDSRDLSHIKIAAVGDSTKNRLLDFGIIADLVPEIESSKGLLERFRREDIAGKELFMPRSDLSDKGLQSGLEAMGAVVKAGLAYRNLMPHDLPDLDLKFFDEIVFTSPSTVRNFKKRYKKIPKGVKISCIGDVTRDEAEKCGLID